MVEARTSGSNQATRGTLLKKTAFEGPQRKLALAFDVGTTFSGVSYSILDPGEIPEVLTVTQFPAQGNTVGSESKIPTVAYYDEQGKLRAAGAEALSDAVVERAGDEGWTKVEWFKLHLRPKSLAASHITDNDLPPLPAGKTGQDILADFFRYLFECTKEFIGQRHANGEDIWDVAESKGNIDFVLTHPNGWEGAQKMVYRRAAVAAGLVPDTPAGQARIQVLTEGEASLHFCVHSGVVDDAVMGGQGTLVVDAGGGTVDLSSYALQKNPETFVEIAASECLLQGSVLISRRARQHLEEKLRGSKFALPEDIESMVSVFDKQTKIKFRDPDESGYIKFGTARDNDKDFGITRGVLKLTGAEMKDLFEPAIEETSRAIQQQIAAAVKPIETILLVGGFAASDWLFSRLQFSLQSTNISFCRPDRQVNKTVPIGAMYHYLNHLVSARVSKWTCGAEAFPLLEPNNPEHRKRRASAFSWPSGRTFIPGHFEVIVTRNTQTAEVAEYRKSFFREIADLSTFETFSKNVLCYKGTKTPAPEWIDTDADAFATLCRVEADMKLMSKGIKPSQTANGSFYRFNFDLVLLFGHTELKAYMTWSDNGREIKGPVTIVYDDI